ncbi:MAG: class I SAM-dependent methyltransferase [Thermoguttaceae bacterium]|jgi:ubiquinone/menaquinone biosynthesis C-methylase UbiE
MDRELFEQMYQGQAPWDTGRPQPAVVKLAEAGQIRGSVLDVGCGTGENVLYLAAKGHESWGLDFVPVSIERAKAKTAERGIDAHFLVGNALELNTLGRQFDTVIDCGLFHTFTDEERPVFVEGLTNVLRSGGLLHILCFSDEEPGTEGPRRISQQEIRDAFQNGWKVQQIEPTRFESVETPGRMVVSPGGPKAWLATIERT